MRRQTAGRKEEVTGWAEDVANIGVAEEAECGAADKGTGGRLTRG